MDVAWAAPAAVEAKRDAEERLGMLGLILSRDFDVRLVVELLTGGIIDAAPFLTDAKGRRLAGELDWRSLVPRIRFEAYDPRARQRFSVCHELGHFWAARGSRPRHACAQDVVNPHDPPDEYESMPPSSDAAWSPTEERLADSFAANFLVPADWLAEDVARFGRCVHFLAVRHGVSPATMRQRLLVVGESE